MKKTLRKDILRSIRTSKARFLSLFLLMTIGSFALIGLKVTGPDLARSGNQFIQSNKVMDLSVLASSGLSEQDKKELEEIPNASIEFANLLDVEEVENKDSVRLYSLPEKLSKPILKEGKLPEQKNEIALASWQKKRYKIGESITFSAKESKLLKEKQFKVVGFVDSSEIWSKKNLGNSGSGDGQLSYYAFIKSDVFNMPSNLARITYDKLAKMDSFSNAYQELLEKYENKLQKKLKDNGIARLKEIQLQSQKSLTIAKNKIDQAKEKILAQEKELEKHQKAIENLPTPQYSLFSRTLLPGGEGYQIYKSSVGSITKVGHIFPVVLYLVAALVTFTTMTRFVDEERVNSGLYAALGYSKNDVLRKFLIYGFLASFLGSTVGILGGTYLLSSQIAKIITKPLILTEIRYYFYWKDACLAYFLASLSALLPVYLIVRKELFQVPAQLLLPKAPTKGSKIILESITILWQKLSFTQKVTLRNIFRYKQRMLMTIFGVAGSVALLFSGLGIRSSLSKVLDHQFNQLSPYHLLVIGNDNDFENSKAVQSFLKNNAIKDYKKSDFARLALSISGLHELQTSSLIISHEKQLSPLLNFKEVKTKSSVDIPEKGVLMSEKLARFYKAKVGQKVILTDNQGRHFKVEVANIIETNVGHYLVMSNDYYRSVFSKVKAQPAYYISLKDSDEKAVKKIARKAFDLNATESVIQNTVLIKTVNALVNSLNQIMLFLVILSVLLALVILYNLTTINIAERLRELSTVKVLGFHDSEVTLYIYRETVILSTLGIAIGIVVGRYLHSYIMTVISAANMNFGKDVDLYVYLIPIIAIVLLVFALGIIVHTKLKKLNMLEALKSVD
ncbi:FtsX-like permease family protein [Streptococcus uberis]|uniref:ABC transporter permease n=1 Tax=Streptococcus uberis TaxID=1349 RepID=UPI003D6A8CDB